MHNFFNTLRYDMAEVEHCYIERCETIVHLSRVTTAGRNLKEYEKKQISKIKVFCN